MMSFPAGLDHLSRLPWGVVRMLWEAPRIDEGWPWVTVQTVTMGGNYGYFLQRVPRGFSFAAEWIGAKWSSPAAGDVELSFEGSSSSSSPIPFPVDLRLIASPGEQSSGAPSGRGPIMPVFGMFEPNEAINLKVFNPDPGGSPASVVIAVFGRAIPGGR